MPGHLEAECDAAADRIRDDLAHGPERERLLRGEDATRVGELPRHLLGEHSEQRRVRRRDAERHLGMAEARGRRRQADVARRRQRRAAAQRRSIDRRDRRDRQLAERGEELLRALEEVAPVVGVAPELAAVHARAEGRAGSGEDHRAGVPIRGQGAKARCQLAAQRHGEGVALLGAIEGDEGDGPVAVEADEHAGKLPRSRVGREAPRLR